MSEIKPEELISGQIYVTRGGTIEVQHDDDDDDVDTITLPWGFDRIRFVRVEGDYLITETPWGTEMSLKKDYSLQTTSETVIRSEFPMRGIHVSRKFIPFDKALEMGICKEVSAATLKAADPEVVTSQRRGETSKNVFTENLIKYFSADKTLASAAEHFGVKYQKIRYTIKNLKDKGYGIQRFTVVASKQNGLSTVRLEKVTK